MKETTYLTKGELGFAASVGGIILAVSISQGATHVWHMGETALEHLWLVGMVCGVLLASQIAIRLAIANGKSGHYLIAAACLAAVVGAERFSYITTRDAVSSRASYTIRDENLNSPEYKRKEKIAANYQAEFDRLAAERESLVAARGSLDPTYAKRRADVTRDINSVTYRMNEAASKLEQADADLSAVNVSVLGATMSDGGEGLARLIALVQCVMPIILNLGTMLVAGRRETVEKSKGEPARKKPRGAARGNLRAV